MSRKNYKASTEKSSRRMIPYDTRSFGSSVVKGMAASRVPDDGLADAYDVIVYPDEIIGREGSTLYGLAIPAIDDRTGYTASKSGFTITAPADTFSQTDVSNYFVFPGSPDVHYLITEYISDTQANTFTTGDQSSTIGCYLRGKTNVLNWHKIARKWVFMWGQQIYISNYDMATLIRCRIISRDLPNNAISGYDDFDDKSALIFNSNGLFKISMETEVPLVYKINTPIPDVGIPDATITNVRDKQEFNHRYLYSACRLKKTGNLINRLTPSKIEQESGTNVWDDAYKDYADVYSDEPVGPEDHTYGILTCGALVDPYINYYGWIGLSSPGSFNLNIYEDPGPGSNIEIIVDFSTVTSMKDVASAIQVVMRDYYTNSTCEYEDGRFVLTTGREEDTTIDFLDSGVTVGTVDVSSFMKGKLSDGASRAVFPTTKSRNKIGPLYVPSVLNTQESQWHLTHFPLYRTEDLQGRYKIGDEADQFNSPSNYIWVADIRVCGSFYGYVDTVDTLKLFFAEIGEFEVNDIGSVMEFDDGSRAEIIGYVDSTTAQLSFETSFPSGLSPSMAAAIGNGRVFRVSQTGNVVTRTHGSTFSSSDVRKPMKWASGYYSYVIEYIDANQVRVADSQDKPVMGTTIDPTYRYYSDNTTDEVLRTRLTRLKLKNRYWQEMPNGNVGKVTPGLIFSAVRGTGELNYGQTPDTLEYLHGYHDKGYQLTNVITDDIQFMWLFQDVLIIWTSRKTWRWPTASYEYIVNQSTKDAILQIGGIEIADEDRGCFDWGSVEAVGDGKVKMLTSEPGKVGWRDYNGFQYGPNSLEIPGIGKDRIPDIQKLQQATRAFYDGRAGLMLFGKEKT